MRYGWRLYEIGHNFLVYNFQLPCIQPSTSLYTTSNFLIVAMVIIVAIIMVDMAVMGRIDKTDGKVKTDILT